MGNFAQAKEFAIAPQALETIRQEFDAFATGEPECAAEMARVHRDCGYLIDPHTAVAVNAARRAQASDHSTAMIALSTAHPAKFPDAVMRATGVHPGLPPHLADLMSRKERFAVLPNDEGAVERFIGERVKAAAA
jgi:threonine synthase